ncbi:hypothetical protein [Cellulomonas sp. URHD0024]|uniref:hypothetical protein n=1 Tax=Cellulomonas sp. URHD0024 TaxID=1302620 RepID=UPI00042118B8|nr:hypothetical protein [Cellulomonas sp. URHD0024]
MTPAVEHRVRDLRLDRRALRAEHARVTWWRRLVRARLDLAVAQAARPQTLGEDMAFQLPPEVGVEVPRPAVLASVLESDNGTCDLRIDELRSLDAQLARYGEGVEAALGRATERLISRLAQEPRATLSGLPEPLGRG